MRRFIVIIVLLITSTASGFYFFRGPLRNIRTQDWKAHRLAWINDYNDVNSVLNLADWIAGTSQQVYVVDDGDGSLTVNLPQDINTVSSPTFVGLTLTGLSSSRLVGSSGADALQSIDLIDWIVGEVNEITVTDDGAGGVTVGIDPNYSSGMAWTTPAPADANDSGDAGDIAYDASYFYVCVATDTWKRTGLTTWGIAAENIIYAGENVIFAGEDVIYP